MSMLVGTTTGLFVIDDGPPRSLLDGSVTAVALGETSFALVGGTVWRGDSEDEWHEVAAVPEDVVGRCILAGSPDVLVGTSNAHLLRVTDKDLEPIDTFDHAPGRDSWYTPWGGPPDTRSMTEAADGTLYVNVHVGGILRSRDGGETWEPTIEVDADVHQVLAHPDREEMVVAATAYGLAVTEDGGDSWTFDTDGLHARYCRAVAIGGDTVFVSASRSHRGEQGAIYRSRLDRRGSFERCLDGLPEWFDGNVDSHWLAANDSTVAAAAPDGHVYVSSDSGATWDSVPSGLNHPTCVALT